MNRLKIRFLLLMFLFAMVIAFHGISPHTANLKLEHCTAAVLGLKVTTSQCSIMWKNRDYLRGPLKFKF